MILLVSGATKYPRSESVGYLVSPQSWNRADAIAAHLQPGRWAMDNAAFSGFDRAAFVWMLEEFIKQPGCLFVTAPDVVSNAAATRSAWPFWSRLLRGLGYPPAFVAQDGLRLDQVPWDELGALFIGGTTAYKESREVRNLCAYAKARGLWVHWGRVNGKRRYELALKSGADSLDGTGFSRHPNINIPKVDDWREKIAMQPEFDL